jgi:hypothetical protein
MTRLPEIFGYTRSVDRLVLASAACETIRRELDHGGTRDQVVCRIVYTRIHAWHIVSCLVLGLLFMTTDSSLAQVVYPSKATPQGMWATPQTPLAVPQTPSAVAPPLAVTPPLAVAPPLAVSQAPLAVPQSPLAAPQASLQCLGTPQASLQAVGTPQCACYYPQGYCPFPSGNCAFPSGNCRAPEGSCVGAQPWAEWPQVSPQVSPQVLLHPTVSIQSAPSS